MRHYDNSVTRVTEECTFAPSLVLTTEFNNVLRGEGTRSRNSTFTRLMSWSERRERSLDQKRRQQLDQER